MLYKFLIFFIPFKKYDKIIWNYIEKISLKNYATKFVIFDKRKRRSNNVNAQFFIDDKYKDTEPETAAEI